MRTQSINQSALDAGKQEIQLLVNAIACDPRFDVQHQISLDRGYFFVDIWRDNIHHAYLSNANALAGEHYLVEKLQATVTRLREICRDFKISISPSTPKATTEQANIVKFPSTRIPPCAQLVSGKVFDYANINAMKFDIEDVAHALSNICRFNGHCRDFYSVAQHSVLVSELVPEKHALAALLRDAAETYCGDVISPLKQLLPVYESILQTTEKRLFEFIGIDWPVHESVKHADMRMLATEVRDLMKPSEHWHVVNKYEPSSESIHPLPPGAAKALFLDRYYSLQSKAAVLAANG